MLRALYVIVASISIARVIAELGPKAGNAFATLLCDDLTLPAIEVLARSIRAAGHEETFLVLTHPTVSSSTKQTLAAMPSTTVLDTDPLPYPFEHRTDRLRIHKPCRFLKLRLWGLTAWRKIVFLDADTMVRSSVHDLFEAPPFSAVKDPVGMNYNTGVLVLEPSRHVHALIINNYAHAGSYNVGDQGALNALLDYEAWSPLSRVYNTFHSAPESVVQKARIIHFSGDSKPWLFWNSRGRGRISTALMHEWCTHAAQTTTAACHYNGELDDGAVKDASVTKHYPETTTEKQMTVLLATYDRDEWRDLTRFYGGLEYVKDVLVVWHKMDRPHEDPPHPKVKFIYPQTDSLNNRFLANEITTEAVYICDDDVYPSRVALAQGFEVWTQNPWRLVGFYPRFWKSAPAQYSVSVEKGYNIVLTKGMWAHRHFLTVYNHFLPKRLTEIVNRYKNCEDILFNMMAVGMTGLPPLAVLSDKKIRDVGRYNGISGRQDGTHLHSRDVCINDFMIEGSFDDQIANMASILPQAYKNYVVEGHEQGIAVR